MDPNPNNLYNPYIPLQPLYNPKGPFQGLSFGPLIVSAGDMCQTRGFRFPRLEDTGLGCRV